MYIVMTRHFLQSFSIGRRQFTMLVFTLEGAGYLTNLQLQWLETAQVLQFAVVMKFEL